MKIRWTEEGVRLRITPGELDALTQERPVVVTMPVPGTGRWGAQLVPAAPETGVEVIAGVLRLRLTVADTMRLADPEAEGVYFEGAGDSGPFRYYVEKDFPCAHPRAAEAREPPTETFAPPPDFEDRSGV